MPEPCIVDRTIWSDVEWPTDSIRSVRNCVKPLSNNILLPVEINQSLKENFVTNHIGSLAEIEKIHLTNE